MKWKKILSFAIVSVLVIGGFTAIAGHTRAQEGELVDEIDFGVTFDMEDGSLAAAEGETHLFMHSIDGPVWQGLPSDIKAQLDIWEVRGSYNNWFLNPAHEGWETAEIEAAEEEGWIEEAEDVRYLANNVDDVWTVNPFAHNDIRFAMQYLNRESIVEDLLLGWGGPRYGPMAAALEVWQDIFVEEIEEKYDLSPEGNWDRVEDYVENAMLEIQEHVAEHPNMGEVTGGIDEGWFYDHPEQDEHQIEIIIMARVEDWREDKGEWTATRLEDLGFAVDVDPTDSATAIPRAFFGNYDQLEYHIYTGGWISTTGVFYAEAAFNQMHMPWYGFMQTYAPEGHWNYNEEGFGQQIGPSEYIRDDLGEYEHEDVTVEEANFAGMDLFTATGVETEDDYWEMKVNTAQHGFEESIRVFAITEIAVYPYNPDKMLSAVPESINGYDTYFGPRTMRTDDGRLDTDILTGEDRPYMDNWNMEEGSADVYGEYQRRLAREYGAWPHPQTGLPMQVNNYWMDNDQLQEEKGRTHPEDLQGSITTDYEYDEGELIENIEIPETAVDYIPAVDDEVTREWMERDELIEHGIIEDEYAAVEVTIDTYTGHVWHDGTEMHIRDVMASYARRRDLGDAGTEPYQDSTGDLLGPWWGSIHAMEWDEEEGTYTIWGDYTFPLDDKLGNYYSIYPWDAHPITYYGWDLLHGGDDYHYEAGEEGQEWIHQLSTDHSLDMIAELQDRAAAGDLPWYLDEANMPDHMAGMALSEGEFQDMVDSFENFVEERGHSYIGIGPYRIDDYDEIDHDMEITRWDDYGYDEDYWPAQFDIQEARLDFLDAPADVQQGEEIEFFVDGTWAVLFPDPGDEELTEDHLYDWNMRIVEELGDDPLVLVEQADIELSDSQLSGVVDTEGLDVGSYWLEFTVWEEEGGIGTSIQADIEILEPAPIFEVTIDEPEDGTEFEEGDTVTVEFTIDNTGQEDGTQDIEFWVDGDEEDTMEMTVEAGESESGEFEWEADETGDIELEVASEDDSDSITIEVEEEEETPGFTLGLLVLGAVVAVAIYYKKEQ